MNALTEENIIRALYRASQAGVKVQLIVRGVCVLRPGIKGISENIRVRSIIGRFLEHPRIFYFQNKGNSLIYCSSADWMDRNFFRRIETCFPIEKKNLYQRVYKQGLIHYLNDNTQAWLLQSDGSYKKSSPGKNTPKSAQEILLEELT
jgi:polyphosphate kinase